LGLPGWTAAQTVQGIILREKSLSPVGGARIAVVDDSGRTVDTTRTDSTSGVFYLNPGKPGHYQLRIQVGRGGLSYSPGFTIDSNETIERKFAVPEWPREVLEAYLPGDVTKKAAYDRGNRPPRYPDGLRAAGRAGVARATVVVNPDGRAAMSTFQVIASDDDAFTDALRDFVDHAHFVPAERDGVKVPQLFEAAADFGFGADPGRLSGDNVVFVRALGVTRRVP
jgi:TonB family protein